MHEKRISFNDVAERALASYGMQGHSPAFIRHSDTVAFKAERPDSGVFLLRIHVPVTATMGTHGTDSIAVASELLWLEALNLDTDLALQKPVRNRDGALVTQVSTTDGGRPVNCTLLQKEELHQVFLDGYQSLRALPVGHAQLVEGFFLGSIIGTFSFWTANPSRQNALVSKVPQIVRDYAARFNQGERFWFA